MTDEYSGVDFAIGTVRGFRSWRISIEGKLEALHQTGAWLPGENTAVCNGSPSKEVVPVIEGEDWKERYAKVTEWKGNHEMESCSHGFYAYFDATGLETSYRPAVHGVIEGYGEVLIGTKGFRAAKARILAISIDPYEGIWNLDQFIVEKIHRNYPNVAFFDSNFAMQAEFPADNWVGQSTVASSS